MQTTVSAHKAHGYSKPNMNQEKWNLYANHIAWLQNFQCTCIEFEKKHLIKKRRREGGGSTPLVLFKQPETYLDFEGRAFAVVKRRNKCSSNRSKIILFEFTNNSYKKYITISWMIHDIGSLEPFDFILAMQSRKRVPDIMFITDKGTTFPPEESWVFGKPSIVRRWRQGK